MPLKSIDFCSSLQFNGWFDNLNLRKLLSWNIHKCGDLIRACLFKVSPLYQGEFLKELSLCSYRVAP